MRRTIPRLAFALALVAGLVGLAAAPAEARRAFPKSDLVETLAALVADPAALTEILLYHVAEGDLDALRLLKRRHVVTLQGDSVSVRFRSGALRIDRAKVTTSNVHAPNGVVHGIDGVLRPGH